MTSKGILLSFFILIGLTAFTQSRKNAIRYKDNLFGKVKIHKNIFYDTSQNIKAKRRKLDIYEPRNDKAASRPVIIWIHGGGFKFGNKTQRGIPLWSKQFAKKGYVCIAINYRFTKKKAFIDYKALADGCFIAMEDVGKVISFINKHKEQYRLDVNRIILGGNSAGGITSLQMAYSNLSEVAAIAGRSDSSEVSPKQYKIAAVINFWGGILNTAWLQRNHVPIVSVHGDRDRIVNIKERGNFLFGSETVHEAATAAGTPNKLKIYHKFGHEIQKHFLPFIVGASDRKRWKQAGEFAASFLYDVLFKNK